MKVNYTPVLSTAKGTLGFRDLGSEGFRVRVEPIVPGLSFPANWKTPDGYDKRYSTVVKGTVNLAKAIAVASSVIAVPVPAVSPVSNDIKSLALGLSSDLAFVLGQAKKLQDYVGA